MMILLNKDYRLAAEKNIAYMAGRTQHNTVKGTFAENYAFSAYGEAAVAQALDIPVPDRTQQSRDYDDKTHRVDIRFNGKTFEIKTLPLKASIKARDLLVPLEHNGVKRTLDSDIYVLTKVMAMLPMAIHIDGYITKDWIYNNARVNSLLPRIWNYQIPPEDLLPWQDLFQEFKT